MSKNDLKRADQGERAPQTKKAKNYKFCISIKTTTTTTVECYFWNCSIYYLLYSYIYFFLCEYVLNFPCTRGRGGGAKKLLAYLIL